MQFFWLTVYIVCIFGLNGALQMLLLLLLLVVVVVLLTVSIYEHAVSS